MQKEKPAGKVPAPENVFQSRQGRESLDTTGRGGKNKKDLAHGKKKRRGASRRNAPTKRRKTRKGNLQISIENSTEKKT